MQRGACVARCRSVRPLTVALLVSTAVSMAGAARDDEPVIVSAGSLDGLSGLAVDEVVVHRLDTTTGQFVPIPFQIDERFDRAFNVGLPFPFVERGFYDVMGEEDGLFDVDDELVFLFKDAGPKAPPEVTWPAGAGPERWEIEVRDPRPGSPTPTRWAYLFRGAALPRSNVNYISWSGAPHGTISTSRFDVGYAGNWILDRWSVAPPCGAGVDLIDRVKGRARTVGTLVEDEENWSQNSTLLGTKLGPIRAIRTVRGATSGVNTIHTDLIYQGVWERRINLRVHPLAEVTVYVDWRPNGSMRLFTPGRRDGYVVDGVIDTVVDGSLPSWSVMRSPQGGMIVLNEVPSSPLFQSKLFHYRDDAAFDDRIPLNPDYGDEDDLAIADHGVRLQGLGDSQVNPIAIGWRVYPLCQAQGEAADGELYRALADQPLEIEATREQRALQPIRTLRVTRSDHDVVLDWTTASGGSLEYRLYAATSPALSQASWSLLNEVEAAPYTDSGEADRPSFRCYSVVEVRDGVEGGW